jgi:putative holliday junction resolvase
MRLLGIDYGSKRVGVALSDEGAVIAQPYKVLSNSKNLIEEVAAIVEKENVSEIILGESKDYKGAENLIMEKVHAFKKALEEKTGKRLIYEPEFMTSQQAEYFQGKHELLDASAAALILQSYLDKRKAN